jgi:hypothetical protein
MADVQLSGALVRPGDRLVVAVPDPLTPHDIEYLQADIASRLSGVDVIVVKAVQLIVYRPDNG